MTPEWVFEVTNFFCNSVTFLPAAASKKIKMEVDPDRILIAACLRGDLQAFDRLVRKYQDFAFNLAFRMLKQREDAEEVAQDAFIKVYRSLSSYRREAKFSTWLYTIVFRESVTRLRKKSTVTVDPDQLAGDEQHRSYHDDGIDLLNKEERSRLIRTALLDLKAVEAAVLSLYYLEEQSLREISEITGLHESNIKVHLHRGRKNLYSSIQKITGAPLNEWL